jgi:3-dehydroquinate dehydratase/shikimate dehydrogenase
MAREIDAATRAGAEMIELRLDYLNEWTPESIAILMSKAVAFNGPVVVTCRHPCEGGHWDGDESSRVSLLEHAALGGANYIDFEYEAWRVSANVRQKIRGVCSTKSDKGRRAEPALLLSKHDFGKTPENLSAILDAIADEPCQVAKLSSKAETIVDSVRMLDALRESAGKRSTIALTMGETGALTRVLAKKFGAMLTFASLEAGKESAPGQVTVADMRSLYRWDAIRPDSEVYGVIGCPVAHSMSPAIHNAAFEAIGYNAVYLPMRIEPDYESFAAFIDGCRERPWLTLRGCSVTIPHKENLLRYVDANGGEIEPLARRIGVANTLCIGADGSVSAHNTDYRGAMDAVMEGLKVDSLTDANVAILGAGGVSRAIVAGLRDAGARVVIYNRTGSKAEALAAEFDAEARPWHARHGVDADVIVNCTSIGMWPHVDDTPLDEAKLSARQAVFDTIYNPIETRLLRQAKEAGGITIDGVTMFVNQAVAQFERWTGQSAPVQVMRDVVLTKLSC